MVENPHTTYLWEAPSVLRLPPHCDDLIMDYCQFNKPWRKRTRIRVWNLSELDGLSCTCKGRHGICSASGKKHIALTGTLGGKALTKIAEPYPKKMVNMLARKIMHGVDNLELAHSLPRVC